MNNPGAASDFLGFPEIPDDRIAQSPEARRDNARLMVLDRATGRRDHRRFLDIPGYFSPGDLLVLNDARVAPVRLEGRKPTGGRVTLLLLKRFPDSGGPEKWVTLITPIPKPDALYQFPEGVTGRVTGGTPLGEHLIEFSRPIAGDLEKWGRMPLPPYIGRKSNPGAEPVDREYYQTVYAARRAPPADGRPHAPGAVAAPTAGLHFTPELLGVLQAQGVRVAFLTLQVGWGTFRPVRSADFRDHTMLPEEFYLPEETAAAVAETRSAGKRVWACGTTVVRVLESRAGENGVPLPGVGEVNLYITPGHRFRAVDRLITNFHLPRHTPLLLAAAFAGTDALRESYRDALAEGYRFLSYGDAMAII